MRRVMLLVGVTVLAIGVVAMLGGCRKEGPLERAGEKVDDAIEKAGEAVEDAGGHGG